MAPTTSSALSGFPILGALENLAPLLLHFLESIFFFITRRGNVSMYVMNVRGEMYDEAKSDAWTASKIYPRKGLGSAQRLQTCAGALTQAFVGIHPSHKESTFVAQSAFIEYARLSLVPFRSIAGAAPIRPTEPSSAKAHQMPPLCVKPESPTATG